MKTQKKSNQDLLIVFLLVILALIFVTIPILENTIVRTILGIPLVLFIPGYALIATLFPRRDDLQTIERIALSFGLSVAVVPLLGLLLNFIYGIKFLSILFTLCIFTTIFLIIAAYRRGKLPEEERFFVSFQRLHKPINNEITNPKNWIDITLTWVFIFTTILAVGMIYSVIAAPKSGEKFTEFYILGTSGEKENYTTNLKYNESTEFKVGVANQEYTAVNYTINIVLDKKVLTYLEVKLDHNETWEKNISFIPNKKGKGLKLEFWLFKDNNFTAPYREIHLWVNVTG